MGGQLIALIHPPGRRFDAQKGKSSPQIFGPRKACVIQVVLHDKRSFHPSAARHLHTLLQLFGVLLQRLGQGFHLCGILWQVLLLNHEVQCLAIVHETMPVAIEDDAPGRGRGAHLHRLAEGQFFQFAPSHHLQPGIDKAQAQHHQPSGDLKSGQPFAQKVSLAEIHGYLG